jgi:hypothetical protein
MAYSPGGGPTAIASIRSPGPIRNSEILRGCDSAWPSVAIT